MQQFLHAPTIAVNYRAMHLLLKREELLQECPVLVFWIQF
jgi:hypothetical protein